jgi:pimeloyl-ACP methyl ester carboxylesterase
MTTPRPRWATITRLLGLVALAALVAALALALVYRSWVGAQVRFIGVLSTTNRTPVVSWLVGLVTADPRVEEAVVAGMQTTVVRPGRGARWPAVVFVNGATARGRHHPDVQRLAHALGRAGYLVLVPDLPGLRRGEITPRTAAATAAVAREAADRPDTKGGRVGLVGVSVGGTLALLAAEDPALAKRISVVAAFAPYTDLRKVIRLATTGLYALEGALVPYRTATSLPLVVTRSVIAGTLPEPDRTYVLARLPAVNGHPEDPLARLRSLPRAALAPDSRALVALLANREPGRFEELFRALPPATRAGIRRMSPLVRARALRAPVEIASAPHDKYFPPAESRALTKRAPHVRLTVTTTLAHAIPKLSFGDAGDLIRFDAFGVRVLHALADA